jgi:hypothetical protein
MRRPRTVLGRRPPPSRRPRCNSRARCRLATSGCGPGVVRRLGWAGLARCVPCTRHSRPRWGPGSRRCGYGRSPRCWGPHAGAAPPASRASRRQWCRVAAGRNCVDLHPVSGSPPRPARDPARPPRPPANPGRSGAVRSRAAAAGSSAPGTWRVTLKPSTPAGPPPMSYCGPIRTSASGSCTAQRAAGGLTLPVYGWWLLALVRF